MTLHTYNKSQDPGDDYMSPFGKARTVRSGSDLTVITYGCLVQRAYKAAQDVAESEGIEVEVIDLRSLWPWDRDTVAASVCRTRRAVIAHEAVRVGGFGAEIAATINEECAGLLLGPVLRIGAPRIPVPYSPPLEDVYRVTAEKIAAGLRKVISGGVGRD